MSPTLTSIPTRARRCHARAVPALAGLAALAAFVAAAGGCVRSPPVRHPDIGVAVPPAWLAAAGESNGDDDDVGGAWWRSFGEDALDATIREAFAGNRDLRAAVARVDRAAAEARIAGADLLPRVQAGFDALRRRQNFVGFPVDGGGEDVASNTFTNLGITGSISWEIDLWGRIRAGKQAAIADFDAAAAELDAALLSLAAQTAKAWFAAREAGRQVDLADETVTTYRETARQVRDRTETGVGPVVDLRLALADVAAAEALLEGRRVIREREVRRLETLIGRYPGGAMTTDGALPEVPDPVPAGLPSELLARRPDIAFAERRLAAADARVAESKAALLPRLSLTASGGTSSEELDDLFSRDFRVWSIAGNLVQPIFEGGRLRARVEANEAGAKEAVEDYAAVVLQAFSEVESALVAEDILRRSQASLEVAVVESREARRLAQDRYGEGIDSLLVVLEAQRRALVNESLLIEVRRRRLDNRVDLHLALGGGFPPPAAEMAAAAETTSDS